ncbi:hypothetical protein [Nesterenkonia haasae]|uniref:hypothetical protein n=1 Tax=Nesterenkonia haasae TaxID=2587813 RepID=UPI001391D80A|nr:hypothetical protein [Nesterenkonia haasae]NDK32036.1 hypothetical protein [Nesterenkonia haasae]
MTMPSLPALTVQPIHFTSDFESWDRFYRQLGVEPAASDDDFLGRALAWCCSERSLRRTRRGSNGVATTPPAGL